MDMIFNYVFGVVGFLLLSLFTCFEFRNLMNAYKELKHVVDGYKDDLKVIRYTSKVIKLDDFRQL